MELEGKIQAIYKNGLPYGIRDDRHYLFFFSKVEHFGDQDRYREECSEMFELSDFLVKVLDKTRKEGGYE